VKNQENHAQFTGHPPLNVVVPQYYALESFKNIFTKLKIMVGIDKPK